VVRSVESPGSVIDYEGFIERRAAYEPLGIGTPRIWTPLA
jgi:hypothetical protein